MCRPQRLEVNIEKTYHIFMSHEHSTRRNHNIKAANRSFENLAEYKYLGRTPPDQSRVCETIKTRLNSGNTIHHSIHFLACNPRIRILKGVHKYNLLVVLYECETRSLKLWEERILRMIDKGVLQMIFRPEREELTRSRRKKYEKLHDMRSSQSSI
jgi:hypothetical protein